VRGKAKLKVLVVLRGECRIAEGSRYWSKAIALARNLRQRRQINPDVLARSRPILEHARVRLAPMSALVAERRCW
jgi:hypothetical protein